MTLSRLEYLFDSYVAHKCSSEEENEFMFLLTECENEAVVKTLIEKLIQNTGSEIQMQEDASVSILQHSNKKTSNVYSITGIG